MKTGYDLLNQAETELGNEYILGADVPLKQGDDYQGPTDCAEFVTEVVQEVTGKIYGALLPNSKNPDPWTGQWFAEMNSGKVIQIPVGQAIRTPGALLLRFDRKIHHIAFSDGNGGTVEAMGSEYGVCRGRARNRFQYGILIPDVQYEEV